MDFGEGEKRLWKGENHGKLRYDLHVTGSSEWGKKDC